MTSTSPDQLLGIDAVKKFSSLSAATIYRRIAVGKFPQAVRLGPNRVAWRSSELDAWAADPMSYGDVIDF
jgi:prophage regulatory protein